MLVVKVFINERQIDELHIQNVARNNVHKDVHYYKVRKPDLGDQTVSHVRKFGYVPLLRNVLDQILIKRRAK